MIKAVITSLLFTLISAALFAQTKQNTVTNTPPKVVLQSGLSASIARGKVLYATYCLTCHQADGGGVPNMNPPLIQTSYVLGNQQRLIKIVLNGFSERVDIDGDAYSNNMPALNFLKDQQVADVLTYIRNDFGNKASAVKDSEVKKVKGSLKK